jgi:hypothetical protein
MLQLRNVHIVVVVAALFCGGFSFFVTTKEELGAAENGLFVVA